MRVFLMLDAVATLLVAPALSAQSLLYRSPNLSGDWVPDAGVVQFNFLHRFYVSPAPSRAVTNFPTFTLAAGVGGNVGAGFRFATRSPLPGTSSNETEAFARWRFWGPAEGGEGLSASVTPAYNFKAKSVDGEVAANYTRGPVTVLGGVRELSKAFGGSTARTALAGGAVIRLNRYVALAGDYAKTLGADSSSAAWSVGIHVLIPGSPHSFALEVSNVASNTYQGSSRGLNLSSIKRLYGFEFTIPLHLSRFGGWFHPGRAGGTEAGVSGPAAAVVQVTSLKFGSDTVRITAGQIVRWVNHDPLEHTITFESEGPVSGTIPVRGSYAVRFDRPGSYAYHCTPHPFMRGVVVVQ